MIPDKVELNFKKGNISIKTIELELDDVNVIKQCLNSTYSGLTKRQLDLIEDGLYDLADKIIEFQKRIRGLMEVLNDKE